LAPKPKKTTHVAVIVAHPDDETLWAGGLLLSHPHWAVDIVTLCRGSDPDRAPRFQAAVGRFHAAGFMGDLDDGPEQVPLPGNLVQDAILALLPEREYDILLTHGMCGEYTWHERHREVSLAVQALWREDVLRARSLWCFAYEDGQGAYSPRPRRDAWVHLHLPGVVWTRKCAIITDVYGFGETSWEALAAPRTEAFDRCQDDPCKHAEAAPNQRSAS
jgi:LmbE family N-acetylglucosaminyl deacetylase